MVEMTYYFVKVNKDGKKVGFLDTDTENVFCFDTFYANRCKFHSLKKAKEAIHLFRNSLPSFKKDNYTYEIFEQRPAVHVEFCNRTYEDSEGKIYTAWIE